MAGPGATSDAPQIILGFDYGTRRIGVASGDTLTRTARALTALQCTPEIPWTEIDRLVADYRPAQFVVGVPYNMDGTPTLLTKASRRFAVELKTRYAQPVALVDERLSSREATEQLRDARSQGLKRRRTTREDIDMLAARIVLERWFDDPAAAQRV
jgi:putative Holliday junction resolvase